MAGKWTYVPFVLHFHRHSLQIIEKHFLEYAVKKQDLLGCEERWNKVINIVPSDNILLYTEL